MGITLRISLTELSRIHFRRNIPQLEYVTQQNSIMYTDQVILIQLIDTVCAAF